MPERIVVLLVAFAIFILWINTRGPLNTAGRLARLPLRLLGIGGKHRRRRRLW